MNLGKIEISRNNIYCLQRAIHPKNTLSLTNGVKPFNHECWHDVCWELMIGLHEAVTMNSKNSVVFYSKDKEKLQEIAKKFNIKIVSREEILTCDSNCKKCNWRTRIMCTWIPVETKWDD